MAHCNKSIRYYAQFYRLIVCAVIVMMAVLTGSLVLGDSVRGTLTDRVRERLGDTETVIASGTGFMDEGVMRADILADARGYLLCEGFVSAADRLVPVMVWATDADSIARGEAIVNEPLARAMGIAADYDDDASAIGHVPLVLHLPSHSLVPSGSLFVTQRYSTQMRLSVIGVRTVHDGGNLLLHNEQALPLNVFVNRKELGEVMDLEGKINLVMSPRVINADEFDEVWTPSVSGIRVDDDMVTADRIFIQQSVVDSLRPQHTCFAYLVNDIYNDSDSVPYSFVTATDSWRGMHLDADEMLLSDYAAERLGASVGDTLRMDYYIIRGMKALETRTREFCVKRVIPLGEIQSDSLLMTEYPGLSNVERCTDWDSDLPINMDRISKEDENFWYAHRQTPKALVGYDGVKDDWSTPFGVATALHVADAAESVGRLTPEQMGIVIAHPVEAGIHAAQNGTDFASLFLALGFFIILSGVLLMQTPLTEMLDTRRSEIELYRTLGYSRRRIMTMFIREAGVVILCTSPIGVLAGVAYAGVTLYLLGNVWSGATHTEGFALHTSVVTIIISWGVGMAISILTLWGVLRSFLKEKTRKSQASRPVSFAKGGVAAGLLVIALVASFYTHSIILFVTCGLLWLVSAGLLLSAYIDHRAADGSAVSLNTTIWRTLCAQRRTVLLSHWSLSVGVFTVFAVGLNRPDFSHSVDDHEVTGGFDLWCESRVPIEYDLNNADVRRKLLLSDLPDSTFFMQMLQYTQDEASCLNLNKVTTPTVLGVDADELHDAFGIDIEPLAQQHDSVYPILMDSESLTWSMMRSVSDTLDYKASDGTPVRLLIAGSYPTGIFHGRALMSKDAFRRIWSDETGSHLMLVRSGEQASADVQDVLAVALSEYGMSITTTRQRIEMFFTVTDTYLAIFLTLGGLGLLLGVFCLIIVVRKSLAARQTEIQTLRALGFAAGRIRAMLIRENLIVPVYAIIMGSIGALISISANVSGAGAGTLLTAAFFLAALLAATHIGIKNITNKYIQNNEQEIL